MLWWGSGPTFGGRISNSFVRIPAKHGQQWNYEPEISPPTVGQGRSKTTSQGLISTLEAASQVIPQGSVAALNFIENFTSSRSNSHGTCPDTRQLLSNRKMYDWRALEGNKCSSRWISNETGPQWVANKYFDKHLARRVGEQCSPEGSFRRKEAAIIGRRFIKNPCHIQVCLICNFVHRTKEVS